MITLAPVLFALLAPPPATAAVTTAALVHPHYPKTVSMHLGFGEDAPKLSVSHLTVTYNADGAEQMAVGAAWHLANSKFVTPVDVTVGGQALSAGTYRVLARKLEGGDWELVLDPEGKDFSREISERAVTPKCRFLKEQPRSEHLRLDLQPAVDKSDTTLWLEVHFDTYTARCLVETA